jgi:hypothetical protein
MTAADPFQPVTYDASELPILSKLPRIVLLSLMALMTGCSAWSDFRTHRSLERTRAEKLAQIDIEECERNGGHIQGVCMFGLPACIIPFSDADKPCSDSSECEGLCWNDDWGLTQGTEAEGKCTANAQECKCGVEIRGGIVDGGICED